MKKLMTIAAIAMAATIFAEEPTTVSVSSQVVGFTQTASTAPAWFQLASPFEVMNSTATEGMVKLSEAYSDGFSDGDEIYIYDPSSSGYEAPLTWQYGYDFSTGVAVQEWGWCSGGMITDKELPVGAAVFVNKKDTSAITFKGNVVEDAIVTFAGEGWAQIGYPYPTTTKVNDMTWDGMGENDEIYIYDTETAGYNAPLTWQNGYDFSSGAPVQKWGWCSGGMISDTDLAPGQAMFINKMSLGNGTLAK